MEEVIEFVREFSGDHKSVITEHTRQDADLGITGDDGVELLEDAEKKFGVSFVTEERSFQETFGLGDNEYLFNSEGLDLLGIGRLASCGEFSGWRHSEKARFALQISHLILKKINTLIMYAQLYTKLYYFIVY
nr:DUF1493 family protein [Pantoea sp. Taur]